MGVWAWQLVDAVHGFHLARMNHYDWEQIVHTGLGAVEAGHDRARASHASQPRHRGVGERQPHRLSAAQRHCMRLGDSRVQALAGALCITLCAVTGITNRSPRALTTRLLGAPNA